jgi:hypothetical protein
MVGEIRGRGQEWTKRKDVDCGINIKYQVDLNLYLSYQTSSLCLDTLLFEKCSTD